MEELLRFCITYGLKISFEPDVAKEGVIAMKITSVSDLIKHKCDIFISEDELKNINFESGSYLRTIVENDMMVHLTMFDKALQLYKNENKPKELENGISAADLIQSLVRQEKIRWYEDVINRKLVVHCSYIPSYQKGIILDYFQSRGFDKVEWGD